MDGRAEGADEEDERSASDVSDPSVLDDDVDDDYDEEDDDDDEEEDEDEDDEEEDEDEESLSSPLPDFFVNFRFFLAPCLSFRVIFLFFEG